MNWLKILKLVIQVIPVIGNILGPVFTVQAEKKAAKVEKVASAVIRGVELYSKVKAPGLEIKSVIKNLATRENVESLVNSLVNKYTK